MSTQTPSTNPAPDYLEAVYYSQQVPMGLDSLTILGLVFDRIYFPGVHLPQTSFDEEVVKREIQRWQSRKQVDFEDVQILFCMKWALHTKYLREFCVFTGVPGCLGVLEDGADDLTRVLEEMVFGPPEESFIPTPSLGFCKGFSDEVLDHQVNGPSVFSYPANALIYAAKHGVLLVNDNPRLPVPGIPASPKDSAKMLSTILAIESVKLVLPNLNPLQPIELQEFRLQTAEHVKPFRIAMLRMAKELNNALASAASLEEVQKHARFMVETDVYPQLQELEVILKDPGKPWYRRAVEFAKSLPSLAMNFSTMPKGLALATLLGRIANTLADLRDEQLDKEHKLGRGGLHYLLKIKSIGD